MLETPRLRLKADTAYGGGVLEFYEEYFEWRPRSAALLSQKFSIRYEDILDIEMIPTHKKQVIISTRDGYKYTVMLYHIDLFSGMVNERMAACKAPKAAKTAPRAIPAGSKEDEDLAKLEKLAELRRTGALTEEEFKAAKAKILGL